MSDEKNGNGNGHGKVETPGEKRTRGLIERADVTIRKFGLNGNAAKIPTPLRLQVVDLLINYDRVAALNRIADAINMQAMATGVGHAFAATLGKIADERQGKSDDKTDDAPQVELGELPPNRAAELLTKHREPGED